MALGSVLTASLLSLAINPTIKTGQFAPFLAAVTVSAWYGGLGPGLVTTILSIAWLDYFFFPPLRSFALASTNSAAELGLVLGSALLITVLTNSLLKARREAESARERLQHELSVREGFLAAAAHDLRSPLAALKMRVQLLQREVNLGQQPALHALAARLADMDFTIAKMSLLINDLLDVARIAEDEVLPLDRASTDLVSAVSAIVGEMRASNPTHHIRLEVAEQPLVAHIDSGRMERVLGNLIDNAVKYSPEGGEIVLSVRAVDSGGRRWAQIEILDHGVGIPAKDLNLIFERFGRARNVAGQIPGTGIGLASARGVIEQHGGTIAVESEEGIGSRFVVRLPLEPPQPGHVEVTPEQGNVRRTFVDLT